MSSASSPAGRCTSCRSKPEAGKEPIEASGAIFTYHLKTGQIILSGGYPWVKQGATFMRAEQPNLILRILKTGSFVTEGKWSHGRQPAEKKEPVPTNVQNPYRSPAHSTSRHARSRLHPATIPKPPFSSPTACAKPTAAGPSSMASPSPCSRREIVGLLGPNGAGKTTSFYMIAGLIPADAGSVSFGGHDISKLPMHRRARLGLGYLPQEESVFRKLSVLDNLLAILETRPHLNRADTPRTRPRIVRPLRHHPARQVACHHPFRR